ncbi:hypothetical protein GIB67_005207 [Kingdonia uniflora]|uniref:Cation/H(+) antiporter C-terminal domain-containing protein n=1 Tax=Kingdonia uniflora TaxID=39325 RepID=A0A7J7NN36_9MAGN|nr:hypothetical protein GIB67_005207 [Kingdonia uniflora]
MSKCNLFLVGRIPQTMSLIGKSDCSELGPLGSYLASSEISTSASVLVIQQYNTNINLKSLAEESEVYANDVSDA